MVLTNLVTATKGLRAEFFKVVTSRPNLVPVLATVVPSNYDSEIYGWLGEAPQMEDLGLTGSRKYTGLSEASYTIKNKEWANGIEVKRKDIKDDQVGAIMLRVRGLADQARRHPNSLLFSLMANGATAGNNSYDGVTFFNTAHPARGRQSATQSNKLTGSGTTTAAFKTDFLAALAAMKKIKDEANEPFHGEGDITPQDLAVIVPPDMEMPAREALNASMISSTTNILQGAVGQIIVSPRLTDVNDWALVHVGYPIKPFIFQDREPLEFEALEDGTGDDAFDRKVFKYGAYARYNAGYGLWQLAVLTTN